MPLIRDGEIVEDPWASVPDGEAIPAEGPVIVGLETWQAERESLLDRGAPVGVRLRAGEAPDAIADDVDRLALVALEFPAFKDGRAYSYARLLRERYGFSGELRAVGDVLAEQFHFMQRSGFDSFDVTKEEDVDEWKRVTSEISVWYQPTSDGRRTARELRHGG